MTFFTSEFPTPEIVMPPKHFLQNELTIRPQQVRDYGPIATILTQAFEQSDEAKLVERLRGSNSYVSDLSLVAEINQQVVGHILFSYAKLEGDYSQLVLVLAPLAVAPPFQGQGIGGKLVRHGLQTARSLGNSLVTVLGHPNYYARFGFEPAEKYGIQSPFPVPPEAFRVKWLGARRGSIRGMLRYDPAFDVVSPM